MVTIATVIVLVWLKIDAVVVLWGVLEYVVINVVKIAVVTVQALVLRVVLLLLLPLAIALDIVQEIVMDIVMAVVKQNAQVVLLTAKEIVNTIVRFLALLFVQQLLNKKERII